MLKELFWLIIGILIGLLLIPLLALTGLGLAAALVLAFPIVPFTLIVLGAIAIILGIALLIR